MLANMPMIVAGLLALIALIGLWKGVTDGPAKEARRAFAGLGLTIGLALGLSDSPVIATALTGAMTLVAAFLPYLFTKVPAVANFFAQPPQQNPPPPPPIHECLSSLTLALMLGILCGVFLRANDALKLGSPASLRESYLANGFTEKQVDAIMAGHARSLASAKPGPGKGDDLQKFLSSFQALLPSQEAGAKPGTNIHASDGDAPITLAAAIDSFVNDDEPASENLQHIVDAMGIPQLGEKFKLAREKIPESERDSWDATLLEILKLLARK